MSNLAYAYTSRKSGLSLLGLNHANTAIAIREKFSLVNEDHYGQLLRDVTQSSLIEEAVVVSTCNRFEIVSSIATDASNVAEDFLVSKLEECSGVSRSEFEGQLYRYSGERVVQHLFSVASGLDSMVIGEPQILGQLKSAFHQAQEIGSTSSLLNRLFHRTFGVAKSVRSKTEIGRHPVSMCFAARSIAEKIFEDIKDCSVMIIGAGEMAALCARHFRAAGVSNFFIVNKTLQRAVSLADTVQGVPLALELLPNFIHQADIVVGAAGAGAPGEASALVGSEVVLNGQRERRGKVQFFVDLGVPRNFAEGVGSLGDVFLYNIDDLQEVIKEGLSKRELAVGRAEELIEEEVAKFVHWWDVQALQPMVRQAYHRMESITQRELETTLRRLRREGFSQLQCEQITSVLRDMCQALSAKVLHHPVTTLKSRGLSDEDLLSNFTQLLLLDQANVDIDE